MGECGFNTSEECVASVGAKVFLFNCSDQWYCPTLLSPPLGIQTELEKEAGVHCSLATSCGE